MPNRKNNTDGLIPQQIDLIQKDGNFQKAQDFQDVAIQPCDALSDEKPLEGSNDRWFVPLEWSHLSTSLSLGVITPANFLDKSDKNIQQLCPSSILIVKDGLSSDITESDVYGTSKKFTALLEIKSLSAWDGLFQSIDIYGKLNKETYLRQIPDECSLIFFPGVISISNIECIHFKSEQDKDNFVIRGFENVPNDNSKNYDLAKLAVTQDLFKNKLSEDILCKIQNIDVEVNGDHSKEILASTDAYFGAIVMLLKTIPARESWFELLKELLVGSQKSDQLKEDCLCIIGSRLEKILFLKAFQLMSNTNLKDGWQGKDFLEKLYKEVDKSNLQKQEISDLEKWFKHSIRVLNNTIEAPKLIDAKMRVPRALLLLCLRPSISDILDCKNSSLEPGDEVLALASMLIGAKIGFKAMPNNLKSFMPQYFLYSDLISNALNFKNNFDLIEKVYKVIVQKSPEGELGFKYNLKIASDIFLEKIDHGSSELTKIFLNARTGAVKINFDVDREKSRLSYTYNFKNGRQQTVYVSVGEPTLSGSSTIRVHSPCLDLSSPKGKEYFTDEVRMKILERHNRPEIYCRIAIDTLSQQLIVVKDLVIESSGTKDMEMLEHVAKFADDFEKEFDLDEY